MRSVNRATLLGNVGKDPEARATTSGTAVTTISLATSKQWRDKTTGEARESTEWHRVICYDRLAEIACQYLRKGSKVYIEGEIQSREYTTREGETRRSYEILARELVLLDSRERGTEATAATTERAAPVARAAPETKAAAQEEDFSDEIPF